MTSIMYGFRIKESTVSVIIRECCLAIWKVLNRKVISLVKYIHNIIFYNLKYNIYIYYFLNIGFIHSE